MRARWIRGIVSVLIVGLVTPPLTAVAQAPPAPPPMTPCAAEAGGLKLICNQYSPEDLVVLPGDQWVVASAFAGVGGIHLIRASDRVSHRAYPSPAARKRPDEKRYSDCPGPPDVGNSVFTTHGLWLQPGAATVHTLFVVGHGGSHPIVSNATDAGRARNRRVDIVVYPETMPR